MADENFGIVVEINPRPALAGTGQIDRALAQNENSARDFERAAKQAMAEVEKAARSAATAQEKAAKDAARAATAATRQAAKDQEETARAMTIAAERRAKERAQVEVEASRKAAAAAKQAADQQKQAQAGLAAAYRQIVGPAADYQQKLAQIIQLERQGAITARQRMQAVAGMQREMKQFSAQQQGGVRGAVSGALSSQFGGAALAAGGVGLAVTAAKGVVDLGDQYITLSNKIRQATTSEAEMVRVREKLFQSADRARVDASLLVGVYGQMRIATKDLGTSQSDLIKVSELLAKATRGVSEVNKSAGLQQFGQALTKGKLQAEELMSILENIPNVATLLARGMNMTVGELRAAAEAGKVGTQQMLDAIKRVGPQIEADFGKSAATSAESWTALKNQVLQTVGGFASQVNVAGNVSRVVNEIASGLRLVGGLVSQQVELWKNADKITGGMLGKLAKQPGILGQIEALTGRIATKRLFGAELIEIQTEAIKAQTAEIERNMRATEDKFNAEANAAAAAMRRDALRRGKSYDKDWNEVDASIVKLAYGKGLDLLEKNKARAELDATRRAMGLPTDDELAASYKAFGETITTAAGNIKEKMEAEAKRMAAAGAAAYQKLATSYKTLEEGSLGVVRAQRDLAEAERTVDAAVRAGLATRERGIRVLDLTRERLRDALDPYQAIIDKMHAERAALSINADEQARYAEVRRVAMDLHRQGVEISDEQVEALHREIEATREATRMIEIKRGIIEGLRGPSENYADQVRAIGQLFAAGAITATEYAEAIAKAAPAVEAFAADVTDSLRQAVEMVTAFVSTDVADAADEKAKKIGALAEVMTQQLGGALSQTVDQLIEMNAIGKSSFSDMASSISRDIGKLIAKMLLFQGLKTAFGFGTGAGGFGATLAGALGIGGFTGFAGGGTIIAGGRGGVDSVPINARVSPGERITFTPPGREAPRAARAAPTTPNVVVVYDARTAALEALRSPEGATVIQATVMGMRGGFSR